MHPEESRFYTAAILSASFLGLLLIYFLVNIIRHQRRNQRLHEAMIMAEVRTLENERKRMASDLHDELGPLISAVKMQINHLEPADDTDRELIRRSSRHIDDILHKIRAISFNLLPNTLVRAGLPQALEEFARQMQRSTGMEFHFSHNGLFRLHPEQEVHIYRMVQEISSNTIKHAQASSLSIRLEHSRSKLVLMTADNGTGFDPGAKKKEGGGLGLINLKSRAQMLHAQMELQSEPGKGTRYIFEIPLTDHHT